MMSAEELWDCVSEGEAGLSGEKDVALQRGSLLMVLP